MFTILGGKKFEKFSNVYIIKIVNNGTVCPINIGPTLTGQMG